MRRFRISIATLAGLIALAAIYLAAVRYIDSLALGGSTPDFVIYAAYGLLPLAIALLYVLGAVARRRYVGEGSPFCIGFLATGLAIMPLVFVVCSAWPQAILFYLTRPVQLAEGLASSLSTSDGADIRVFLPVLVLLGVGLPISSPCLVVAWVGGKLSERYRIVVVRRTPNLALPRTRPAATAPGNNKAPLGGPVR